MFDRRTFLKAASTGVVLGAAVGEAVAGHEDQFERVRQEVVEPYLTDPQQAADDGYVIGGPYVPSMGWHFLNQRHVQEATATGIDITKPQVLVYVDERFVPNDLANRLTFDGDPTERDDDDSGVDTGLRLGAVEYAIPRGARGHTEENPPDLFDDEDAEFETSEAEGWHVHPKAEHAFATHDGEATGRDAAPARFWEERLDTTNWLELVPGGTLAKSQLSPGDTVKGHFGHDPFASRTVVSSSVHPDLLTLHVWFGIDNPEGVFAGHNPALGHGDGHDH